MNAVVLNYNIPSILLFHPFQKGNIPIVICVHQQNRNVGGKKLKDNCCSEYKILLRMIIFKQDLYLYSIKSLNPFDPYERSFFSVFDGSKMVLILVSKFSSDLWVMLSLVISNVESSIFRSFKLQIKCFAKERWAIFVNVNINIPFDDIFLATFTTYCNLFFSNESREINTNCNNSRRKRLLKTTLK